jgi:hypothetical protein
MAAIELRPDRDCIRESLSALVRLIVLGEALVMIGAVLIGLAWLYNEYGATAFWIGVGSIVIVVWVERNPVVIPVYEATIEDAPERCRDPATRPFRRRARKLGLVRRAMLSRRAVQGLLHGGRGRTRAGRQSNEL